MMLENIYAYISVNDLTTVDEEEIVKKEQIKLGLLGKMIM